MAKEFIHTGLRQPKIDVTIDREVVKPREDAKAEKANFLLKTSGEVMTPPGCEYVGSFAGHIYVDSFNPKSFTTITQAPIGKSHEIWCDIAWKEVRKKIMAAFGRKEPDQRK